MPDILTRPLDGIADATQQLFRIARFMWKFIRAVADGHRYQTLHPYSPCALQQIEHLDRALQQWKAEFDLYYQSGSSSDIEETQVARKLLVRYHLYTVSLAGLTEFTEQIYDKYDHSFQEIVKLTSDMLCQSTAIPDPWTLSLDVDIVYPLYFTAAKCRHRGIRRKAIELLLDVPYHVGVWDGTFISAVATKVIEMEEQGLSEDFLRSNRIPESQRIHSICMRVIPRKQVGILLFRLLLHGLEGGWSDVRVRFTWPDNRSKWVVKTLPS